MIGIKGVAKKPIIDATANPEDVSSGKIFYNNNGRCTGTMGSDMVLHKSSITIPSNSYAVALGTHCVHTLSADPTNNTKKPKYLMSGNKRIYAYGNSSAGSYVQIINCPTLYLNISESQIEYIKYGGTKMAFCEPYYSTGGGGFASIYDGYQSPAVSAEYVLIPISTSIGLAISVHPSGKYLGSIGLYRISSTLSSSNCNVSQTTISVVYHD